VTRVAAGKELGQGDAIRFLTPSGHPFEIYYDIEKPQAEERARTRLRSNSASKWRKGMSPRRFDHINVSTVRDEIQPVTEWLNKSLGFNLHEFVRPTGRDIAASWMAVTSQVHDIALSRDFGNERARLHHFAYEFDSFQDVFRAADIVRDHGLSIELGPGLHGITQAMFCYLRDPGSDHRLELFSGAYHVFDPDWEPVEWTEHDVADGMCWWGPDWKPGSGSTMDATSPGGLALPS
jgi:catechol 2,3-dioxygenase